MKPRNTLKTKGHRMLLAFVAFVLAIGLSCATYKVNILEPEELYYLEVGQGGQLKKAPLPHDSLPLSGSNSKIELIITNEFCKKLFTPDEMNLVSQKYGAGADIQLTCQIVLETQYVSSNAELQNRILPVKLLTRKGKDDGAEPKGKVEKTPSGNTTEAKQQSMQNKEEKGTIEEAILNGLETKNLTYYYDGKVKHLVLTAILSNPRTYK